MARNVTDNNRREAEILLAALKLIKDNGGEMKYSAIKEELPNHFHFTEKELSPRRTWGHFWYAILGMIGYIELKQTGIIDARKGVWSLTKVGEDALVLSPEEFYKLYHYRYLDIQKAKTTAQQSLKATTAESKSIEEVVETDIEALQEKAREQIRQYIIRKDPYEFQNMVAALFRAMGYFTPFVAPKGRDGGVDVIAYCDPLGVKKPHIKVQVKHYPSNPISVDVVRSLTGLCRNADEMGFVITSGSFTNEAQRESRSLHNNIRLIDGEDFIDLWLAYYGNMPDEDKVLMPIVPIYHLNIN